MRPGVHLSWARPGCPGCEEGHALRAPLGGGWESAHGRGPARSPELTRAGSWTGAEAPQMWQSERVLSSCAQRARYSRGTAQGRSPPLECPQMASLPRPTAEETGGLVCGSLALPWAGAMPCPPTCLAGSWPSGPGKMLGNRAWGASVHSWPHVPDVFLSLCGHPASVGSHEPRSFGRKGARSVAGAGVLR